MNWTKILICILLMATVSYLPRVIPLVLVKKKITNTFVCSMLTYLPYGLLAAMIFPEVFYSTGHFISATVGVVMAIGISLFKRAGLFTVTLCGCVAVFITECVLRSVGMM